MNDIEQKLKSIKTKDISFQINTILERKPGSYKVPDNIKIIKGNIYVYIIDQSVIVYNCISFKNVCNLKLPFEPLIFEITEENTMILFLDKKVYFYKFNLEKKQINFIHYFSDIYHFCYLEKRKEVLLLTENRLTESPLGMAKSDLSGKIKFYNKIKPNIYCEFKSPKPIDTDELMWYEMNSKNPIHFSKVDGFNKDKYIIIICGSTIRDDCFHETEYTLEIYKYDNLKKLIHENYEIDLRCKKITDKLFKKQGDDKNLFYYDEKKNKIKYINQIYEGEYFYLNDVMFGCFNKDNNFLYIIDLSINYITRKIKINDIISKDYKFLELVNMCYFSSNNKEYLYTTIYKENNYKSEHKIIHGIIQ